jgi:curved DNA-binding protein CbpA
MKTYYQLLEVSETAESDEIKTAFRKKAKVFHPDKGGSKEMFQLINEAYHILSEPARREEYDSSMAEPSFSEAEHFTGEAEHEEDINQKTSPNIAILISYILMGIGVYLILYLAVINICKLLHLEILSNFIYIIIVYCILSKSLK